ncbi:aminotransferase class I/II-fold pyridoxal phosphate-dependent enzyme [Staphylococcus gallinarum]|uniref:aminotransferase class I/II-fold pyridoxal phosphate-dependent enzyme n=1 Tax=Staphylococcus gallinarum TaxID=1293 RepID=UPI00317FB3F9
MNIQRHLKNLHQSGMYRELKSIESVFGKFIFIDGQRYINFTSNDYLGLGQLAFNVEDFEQFMKKYSLNLSSSRLVSGNSIIYDHLETEISSWLHFENCLISNSGYDANLTIFNTLKDENVLIFSDEKNHASIIDGIKLNGLKKLIYNHLDYDHLESMLGMYAAKDVQKIIVSDSVFSTNGHIIDMDRLVALKNKYDATLLIDASHSLGLNIFKDYQDVDVLTASLSKAWGAHGGVILCNSDVKELMVNQGRPVIYSSSLPIYNLFFIKKGLHYLSNNYERQANIAYLSNYFNECFKKLLPNQLYSVSPIKYITFDHLDVAEEIYHKLLDNNIFLSYLRYPTVQKPTLRISLSYFHDEEDVDKLFTLINQYYRGE